MRERNHIRGGRVRPVYADLPQDSAMFRDSDW